MKKTLLILPILIIVSSLIYVGYKYKYVAAPAVDVKQEPTKEYKLSATRLFNEYGLLEMTANSKYTNHKIEVNGKIREIQKNSSGETILIFDAGNSKYGVACHLQKSENKLANQVEKEQEISVKGTCKGMMMDVVLVNCTIEKASLFQF